MDLTSGVKCFDSNLVITFQVPECRVEIDTLRNWQNLRSGSQILGVRALLVGKPRPPPFTISKSKIACQEGPQQLVRMSTIWKIFITSAIYLTRWPRHRLEEHREWNDHDFNCVSFTDVVSSVAPDMSLSVWPALLSLSSQTVTPAAVCFHMAGTVGYFQHRA